MDIIVVDDGSTDGTDSMIAERFPSVRYFYQSQRGVSAARNLGLSKTSADWIALLDSDDEWLPIKLLRQFEKINQTGFLICHSQEIWIRNGVRVNQKNKHKKQGGRIFQQCLPLCVMSPSSIIFHKSVLDKVGTFDETLPACEDYDLWLRISAEYEVAYVETPLIRKYGGHADQLSGQYWGMDRFRVIALEKILGTKLPNTYYLAAKTMLINKLKILLQGAIKHKNAELINDCEQRLTLWN